MTQMLQTKDGIALFTATVQMMVTGVEIQKKGDQYIAWKDGNPLGPVVGEAVTAGDKKVKLENLISGIDPATLVGKNFADMTPAEQLAWVRYLEGLAGDKIGKPAAAPAKAETAAKKAEAKEGEIAVPKTLSELEGMDTKTLYKLAKQLEVEGVMSRTPKAEMVAAIAKALGLTAEEAEEAEEAPKSKGGKKGSTVFKSDEEAEEDSDDDEDEDDEEDDSDDDEDEESDEDEDADDDSDDEDEDEDEDEEEEEEKSSKSRKSKSKAADDDEEDEEDDDEDSSDEDDESDDDEDDDDEDDDEDEEDDDEDEDEDEEDEEDDDDDLAALRKKWTPAKVDTLTTKEEINALRKACGITYEPGTKLSPVKVKEDIKALLFGKGKKK